MDYELVKQLKGVGYELRRCGSPGLCPNDDLIEINNDFYFQPTLSELIYAMPMRAKYLGTINDAHFVLRKLVSGDQNQYWAYMEDEDTDEPVVGYSFREEPADVVVAKLYIKLNEK